MGSDAWARIDELQRHRVEYYRTAYPQAMNAIRPEILRYIPLASASKKYLDVLLQCEACLRISEHHESRGDSRAARDLKGSTESVLFALTAADSHRGALIRLLAHGQLPRGWKVPRLVHPEVKVPPAMKGSDIAKTICGLEELLDKSRRAKLAHWIVSAKKRLAMRRMRR